MEEADGISASLLWNFLFVESLFLHHPQLQAEEIGAGLWFWVIYVHMYSRLESACIVILSWCNTLFEKYTNTL